MRRAFEDDPRYRLVEGDAKDAELLTELAVDCDHLVAGAAMIGGISYFHEFAYDLLAENERICAATFDAALSAFRLGRLQKITVLSSSMVFESASVFPTPEGAQLTSPPPRSTPSRLPNAPSSCPIRKTRPEPCARSARAFTA